MKNAGFWGSNLFIDNDICCQCCRSIWNDQIFVLNPDTKNKIKELKKIKIIIKNPFRFFYSIISCFNPDFAQELI
jgi:hypothetical protein